MDFTSLLGLQLEHRACGRYKGNRRLLVDLFDIDDPKDIGAPLLSGSLRIDR
jgi:hypothetical protein